MEGKRIGIVVGGAGAIPEAAIRMAQEHDVELVRVEDIKQEEYEPTRIPEQVYTIYPRPDIPDITLYDPPRMGKGGSKRGRSEKQIRKDRKKRKINIRGVLIELLGLHV